MKNTIWIGAVGIREALFQSTDPPLSEMTLPQKAARAYALAFVPNGPCWACGGEDDKFAAAGAGLMLAVGEEDRIRIEREYKLLNVLSAAISAGAPLDFNSAIPDYEPIGLFQLFQKAKAEAESRFYPLKTIKIETVLK